jgi:hypothetical protein
MNSKKICLLQGLALLLVLQPSAWANDPISHSAKDLVESEERGVRSEENLTQTSELKTTQNSELKTTQNSELKTTQNSELKTTQNSELKDQNSLDLDPTLIQKSPVLQRWMNEIPDVAADIKNDPSFRTRIRSSYSNFSSDHASGFNVGLEELRVDRTRLTLRADYQRTFEGDRQSWGTDLHYYMRPLGSYVNVAPVVGYRHLKNDGVSTNGLNVGFRLLLVLSRGGGSDISLTQTWVAPGSDEEAGISTLSFGYALTHQLRLSTDLQRQNTNRGKDDRFGIGLEWML